MRSCVVSCAGRSYNIMVVVILVGPSCLLIFQKVMVMNNHESHVFWCSVPPSYLLIIVMQPPGARPLRFWCFVEILLWKLMPICCKYLCWWIFFVQLSSYMSGMVCGFPWVSLHLNLFSVFPILFGLDGNETLAGLCWWYWPFPHGSTIILLRPLCWVFFL